jgi:hypothetical protein
MVSAPIVLDALSPLSHKERIGLPGDRRPATLATAPSWVPRDDQRRLDGYDVLEAYRLNVGRINLPVATTEADRAKWREYGDPAAIIDRIAAAVLGDDWHITVDGADGDLLAGPDLPERPTAPAEDADPLVKRIHAGRLAAWRAQAEAAVATWEQALADQPAAVERQTQLRGWADQVQLAARLHEAERDGIALGDAVYVLWRQAGDWPKIEVYHPGFYFADLSDNDRGDYPSRVDFGWEFDEDDGAGGLVRRVRRMTFELVDINSTRVTADGTRLSPDGMPLGDDEPFALHDTDVIDSAGIIRRRYPWLAAGVPTADLPYLTCVYSSASWLLADTKGRDLRNLDERAARWDVYRQDQHCDFIPVVHVPNTPTGSEHYGVASITSAAQVLDDLAQTDTRIMEASQFLGLPTATVAGAKVIDAIALRPGTAIGLGENGRMDMLDMSASIDKLYMLGDRLVDRLLANLGAPREVMGRVDDTTASGIHLLIKYLPWAQVIGAMRLPREPKMRLLLKFAQRLAQVEGVLEPGPTPTARLRYGNFLPTNQAETVEMVTKALGAHAISRTTALRLLVAAGLPIDDANAELARIDAEDPEGAKAVADATGSEALAAERLGLELPTPPATDAPTLNLP